MKRHKCQQAGSSAPPLLSNTPNPVLCEEQGFAAEVHFSPGGQCPTRYSHLKKYFQWPSLENTIYSKLGSVAHGSGSIACCTCEVALVAVAHPLNAEEAGGAAKLCGGHGRVRGDLPAGQAPGDADGRVASQDGADDLRPVTLVQDCLAKGKGNNFRRF